tara:strand:+ start:5737 stop:6135 length:399 start_codon:yes stop_codon:yes gene_type:complete
MIRKVFDFFEEHNLLSWFVVVVGAIGIFIISSLQFPVTSGAGTRLLPILYHIVAFFFLSLFLLIALIKGERKYSLFLVGIVLAVSYGITDEIHQFFVPGRSCTGFDVFLDFVGIMFASMVYMIRVRWKKLRI